MHLRDSTSSPTHEQPSRLVVLTLGLSQPIEDDKLAPFRAVHAKNAEDALRILTEGGVAALLLGPCADLLQVPDLLAHSAAKPSGNPAPTTIVLCAASEPDTLQKLVDAGQIFYAARGEVSAEQLRNLITCGTRHFALIADQSRDRLAIDDERSERLLDLCTRLPMQTDLAIAGRLLIETGRDLLQAKIMQCFVYDADTETLTATDASESEKRTYSAASGLVAFVARTGEHVRLDCIGTDARYDFDIDAPLEMRSARFLAEPVLGPAGLTACVLTALRGTIGEVVENVLGPGAVGGTGQLKQRSVVGAKIAPGCSVEISCGVLSQPGVEDSTVLARKTVQHVLLPGAGAAGDQLEENPEARGSPSGG